MITRRAALLGIGAALAAPAVVRAESLMKIVMPKPKGFWGLPRNFVWHKGCEPIPAVWYPEKENFVFQSSADGVDWERAPAEWVKDGAIDVPWPRDNRYVRIVMFAGS